MLGLILSYTLPKFSSIVDLKYKKAKRTNRHLITGAFVSLLYNSTSLNGRLNKRISLKQNV